MIPHFYDYVSCMLLKLCYSPWVRASLCIGVSSEISSNNDGLYIHNNLAAIFIL